MVNVKFIKSPVTNANDENSIVLQLADFEFKNMLQFSQNRERALDGTMIKNDNSYYVVSASFAIANMTLADYSKFVRIVNSPSFYIECFDYEICKYVHREMTLPKYSRNRLLTKGQDISDIIGIKLEAEGVESFKNYEELMSNGIINESAQILESGNSINKSFRWI